MRPATALGRDPGSGILAQPGGTGGQSRIPGDAAPGISQGRVGVAGRGFAPRLPQADGRIAGHGRHERLHQAAAGTDCSLRKAAGRSCPRAAVVLRHRIHAGRIRQPGAGREPHVSSDQDRRQRRSIRPAWAAPTFSPRPRSWECTIRPFADRDLPGRHSFLGIAGRGHARAAEYPEKFAGSGHPHPDADGFLADAGRPVAVVYQDLSPSQVARVRAGQSRQRARRRASWHSASRSRRNTILESGRNSFRSTPIFSTPDSPASRATRAISPSAAIPRRAR